MLKNKFKFLIAFIFTFLIISISNVNTANATSDGYTLETGEELCSHFDSKLTTTIYFSRTSDVPSGYTQYYQVGASDDDLIYLYTKDYTTIYIASEKKIYANEDSSKMFYRMLNVNHIYYKNFDTSNVTDMSYMFYNCNKPGDLSSFDTSNVTNMSHMFDKCGGLTKFDFTNFDTSNVTDMSYMFNECQYTKSIDLSSFNTSNVTSMRSMFNVCNELENVNLSSFDTKNVTDMSIMFYHCRALKELELGNFNTAKVTNMQAMFAICTSLEKIDLSNFDTSNVTNISYMFYACTSLTSANIDGFDTSNVKSISNMFDYCIKLKTADLSSFQINAMYASCRALFRSCNELTSVDLSGFCVTNACADDMFENCENLKKVTLGKDWEVTTALGTIQETWYDENGNSYYYEDIANNIKENNIYTYYTNNTKDHTHAYTCTVSDVATTTKNGVALYECSECGYSYSKTIAKINSITLETTSYAYNGSAKKPSIVVKGSDGKIISSSYYKVAYSNNVYPGIATAKITFSGNYYGTVTKKFTIKPKVTTISSLKNENSGITIKWSKVTGASGYYIYRSKNGGSYAKIKTIKSASTVSYTDSNATSNGVQYKYYIIAYKTTDGTTLKSASSSKKTIYRLTRTSISSLKSSTTKKMTVKWNKNTKTTGYVIEYSTSSSFSSKKTITIKNKSTTSKTISGLTKGKTYYVRIRAYKTVSGTKYYSAYSTTKKVKIK